MKKIDYILLSRHFRGETSEPENQQICCWKESCSINRRTYERLSRLCSEERKVDENQDNLEEVERWSSILSKILAEN
ncbi:hypothetical protein [Arcicella rosea]|nr:hypothetical protein [Arcicella rosea]